MFIPMLLSFFIGVALLYYALIKRKERRVFITSALLGLMFMTFFVYLGNPFHLWDFTIADNFYDYFFKS